MLAAALVPAVFGATDSPYMRVDGGPLVQVGRPERGSWSVTTVRVRRATWWQWARAEASGGRTFRARRAGAERPDGTSDEAMAAAMAGSQTAAVLVAAQLAAGRAPVGAAGLQVTADTGAARAAGLRAGDVLLAAGRRDRMAPLRAPADLEQAAARGGTVRLLVAPKTSGGTWGAAAVRRTAAERLAALPAGPDVSARAYPMGDVEGPSAGLLLALARIDDLAPGDLTGGRRIAGTGAIGFDGMVAGVGEVAEKVRSAAAARVEVFFVPAAQEAEAVSAARDTPLRVVPVRSVSEAVHWLCGNGGHAPTC
ncbi:PDZ/DHR/GLGF domain-containing protein [Actinomadura verrucosospora]|uniref:PDZ/DHR/GLGF domain-containing protein n=1 Tax=Actinomadura verrucosospora TaxID=46165 RepID=A0A7D3ZYP1_ACTVE|nr:PDZ/DHR/GLGF domain-containing protein [Actinomadura verrucosospora]